MKKSTTKRALFLSFVSMFLCFTMLLGTTYAWFTDSVASDVNHIVAGNLDVELLHTNDEKTDETVTGDTKLFTEVEKWEPGVIVWEKFTVKNVGTLALKYVFSLNATNATVVNNVSFADLLKVAVIEDDTFVYNRANIAALTTWESLSTFAKNGELKAGDPAKTYGIVIYWQPSDQDNLFNMNNANKGKEASVDVGVNLFATQMEAEKDSFDANYDADADAVLPVFPATISNTIKFTPNVDQTQRTETEDGFEAPARQNLYYEDDDTKQVPADEELTTKVKLIESSVTPNSFTFEIEVVDSNGDKVMSTNENDLFIVPLEIGTGFASLTIDHDGEDMTQVYTKNELVKDSYYYDFNAGIVYVAIVDFSPFNFDFVSGPAAIVNKLEDLTVGASDSIGGTGYDLTLDCGYQFLPAVKTKAEAEASGFGKWHADFVVSVDKDVNIENGSSAGLAGYYSAWCDLLNKGNWLAIPVNGEIKAGDELRLLGDAVYVNYEEICEYSYAEGNTENGFLCGAYDDGCLKGVTLKVELRLYETYPQGECPADHNGHSSANCETGKYITIATTTYTFN
ncbi:MAG: hypothetical protein IKB02_06130 [Clostridia bacterium]|nr:hypothetical protein [Clostridia bacterium]